MNSRFLDAKRYKEMGQVKPLVPPGKRRSVRMPEAIKRVREGPKQTPAQSRREIARQFGTSKPSIYKITQSDLHFRACNKQKVHDLADKQKETMVARSKQLIVRHAEFANLLKSFQAGRIIQ